MKAILNQYLGCLPECLFIQQLFLLFLRTVLLLWFFKVDCLTIILPTRYLSLSGLWSQHVDLVTLRKKRIFMYLYIIKNIANTKSIYQSYQVTASSRSAQFLKFRLSEGTRIYWKSKWYSRLTRNNKFGAGGRTYAKTFSTLILGFLILMCSFIYRESSGLVDRKWLPKYVAKMPL